MGKQMLTWLLQVKRKEKTCADKQELSWEGTETPIHQLQFAGHATFVHHECVFASVISIHSFFTKCKKKNHAL